MTTDPQTVPTESLGAFGQPRAPQEPVNLTFTWYGESIRVDPGASELDLIEFMATAGDVDEADVLRLIPPMQTFLKALVHDEDWPRFWRLSRANHADAAEDMLPLCWAIVQGVTGRPTVRPSDSTERPSGRPGPSTPDSSSPVDRALVGMPAGRPDLLLFITDAQGITGLDAATG